MEHDWVIMDKDGSEYEEHQSTQLVYHKLQPLILPWVPSSSYFNQLNINPETK